MENEKPNENVLEKVSPGNNVTAYMVSKLADGSK